MVKWFCMLCFQEHDTANGVVKCPRKDFPKSTPTPSQEDWVKKNPIEVQDI